jgi:RNA polymerase sigma factor for flagellar operon FliA
VPRVRGAILDELRSIDWVPRSVRAKARAVDFALSKLEGKLGRSPTDRELADEMEMSTSDLDDILRQTSRAGLLQLDDVLFRQGGSGGQTLGDTLQDRGAVPGETIELEETRRQLAKAIQRLDERERKVLTLYYYEGLNLAEIGEILGVTESRACQIHTKAVLHLRQRLRDELT